MWECTKSVEFCNTVAVRVDVKVDRYEFARLLSLSSCCSRSKPAQHVSRMRTGSSSNFVSTLDWREGVLSYLAQTSGLAIRTRTTYNANYCTSVLQHWWTDDVIALYVHSSLSGASCDDFSNAIVHGTNLRSCPEPSVLHLHIASTLLPVGCVPVKLVCGTYCQYESHLIFVFVFYEFASNIIDQSLRKAESSSDISTGWPSMSMNIYWRYILPLLRHHTFPATIVSFLTVDCALIVFRSLKLGMLSR